jgi:ABC-type branched-subunit amino acid transport system permease subunit
MDGGREISPVPSPPDGAAHTRIGVDEWVAEAEERRRARHPLVKAAEAIPRPIQLAVFVAVLSVLPFLFNEGNLFRYGLFTLIYALLALGLNVSVGFAGLLDLGFIAFYGFGAYFYAILASPKYGIHWQAEIAIPVVMIGAALLGLLLGLPSRRLLGDYLAIVTLFFGQAFVVFVNTANPKGLTGGANGIANVDPLNFFGFKLTTTKDYYYFTLIAFLGVIGALYFMSESRTGRAWRSLREDPLAAELMGTPVNRLKIMAFMFGAAIAGLTGTIFAANQTGVFPGDFDVSILITIYAVMILGGLGSLFGMFLGAAVINVSFELLSGSNPNPSLARWLFYLAIITIVIARIRPWLRVAVVVLGTVVFGFVVHLIVHALDASATRGAVTNGGSLTGVVKHWAVIPQHPGDAAKWAYVGLVAGILVLTLIRGWWRALALIPVLYLATFVWENLLAEQPAVTRLIVFGAMLIALMAARPQGLLGTARVEIA